MAGSYNYRSYSYELLTMLAREAAAMVDCG